VLSERQWWKVVSSDLPRCKEMTAHLLDFNPDAPDPLYNKALRDFACGVKEGHPTNSDEKRLLAAWTGRQPPPK